MNAMKKEKLNIGLIGCGTIGTEIAKAIEDKLEELREDETKLTVTAWPADHRISSATWQKSSLSISTRRCR